MAYLDTAWPRVLAHRGFALDAPENTLLAFQRALDVGATHLETDVHASADGAAILCHDPDLSRLTGRPDRIGELTLDELQAIDLGHGQCLTTLDEALTTFPDARFNIDVKDAAAIEPTAAAIMANQAIERVLVTSFSARRRRAITALLPGVASSADGAAVLRVVLGTRFGIRSMVSNALDGLIGLQIPERHLGLRVLTPRLIDAVHAAGAEVHVWTVNDPAVMRRLLAAGVDGLVTDRADLAVPIARASSRS